MAHLGAALATGVLATVVLVTSVLAGGGAAGQMLDFTPAERRAIADHGPGPPAIAPDTSNRWQADPALAALGRRLFFDPGLSGSGRTACASCHQPARAFQDGRATAIGDGPGPAALAQPGRDAEALLADVGKALAAFQATLVSPRTAFDDFRDALVRGDADGAARYPLAAQRGLRLFVGRGRCALCHAGPRFSNGEFADIGVPFFVPGELDAGRHGGIRALRGDLFNRLGRHADDGGAGAVATRHARLEHRHFGEFKVPGLRQPRHAGRRAAP